MTLNPADQAFYEWYHQNPMPSYSIEILRKMFMSGWDAHAAFIVADEEV